MLLFKGRRVVFSGGETRPASITVTGGRITAITDNYSPGEDDPGYDQVVDAGDLVLMPGIVDSHVHINEPGRTEWEGFSTATQAGAAGGITTIIDMPLNSLPSTTTPEAFHTKLEAARGKLHVDVGFWGGVVPRNQPGLRPMLDMGICGFKCFMIDSGVEEFQYVIEADIRSALSILQGTDGKLLFHAEVDTSGAPTEDGNPKEYGTFLATRPDSWEVEAIDTVCRLCAEYRVPCHIVHLASAAALPSIKSAKESGAPLTVETTHHYLTLDAESIPDGATEYKCCPPIRSKNNQILLWDEVESGVIDMVVSDHSPCTPDLKLPLQGDFMKAWGGIASVQFGLSLFWTGCIQHGMGLPEMVKCLCEGPALLAGLQNRKGAIDVGMDADFVIWDPDDRITVTPYMNRTFSGKVVKTFVRGNMVYAKGTFAKSPKGELLLPNGTRKY